MKRKNLRIRITSIMMLTMLFVAGTGLVSCNSGKNNGKYSAIAISKIDNQNSTEAVVSKEYENLTFSEDFRVEFPDITSFSSFTMTLKPFVSPQETYKQFTEAVELYFPDTFTEEEKKEQCQVTGEDANKEIIRGTYASLTDKLESIENDIAMLLISDKGTIQTFGCGYTYTATGTAAYSLDHPEGGTVGMYIAADENTIVEKIYVPQGGVEEERVYPLLDGEVKLTDAIAYTEDFFENEFDRGIANPELTPEVCEAWVVDMGDGIYGYHLVMAPTYQQIRFDTQPMNRAGSFGTEGVRNSKDYANFPGYVFTIEKEKMDAIMIVGGKLAYDIMPGKTYTKMITAEQATEILSEKVSGHAGLIIERAEFLYAPYREEVGNGSVLTVDAVWRFVGRNKNDGFRYLFYVNAVTGELDYYKYS